MTSLVGLIPRWVKEAALERGAMTAIEKRDVMVLTMAPLEGASPRIARSFSLADYAADADACWAQVLEAFEDPHA